MEIQNSNEVEVEVLVKENKPLGEAIQMVQKRYRVIFLLMNSEFTGQQLWVILENRLKI